MMNHLHPDHLAALAIEPEMAGADDEAHLQQCPRCRGELATLRDVSARARRAQPGEPSPAPPESVWDNVVRELSASGDLRPQLPERRRTPVWRQPWAVAAALVVAAVVAAAVLLPFTSGSVVAQAPLEPLAQVPEARATLVADGDERSLNIESLDLPAFDGYYELWLLTTDGQRLVSLGPIDDAAQVDIPAGIDPGVYSVVDISREPPDGDPSHSTDSVLRGPLETDA